MDIAIETDLTYEGIATREHVLYFGFSPVQIETDLTYEGIATQVLLKFNGKLSGIETDLTYEGIATIRIRTGETSDGNKFIETDLTYEGIATRSCAT